MKIIKASPADTGAIMNLIRKAVKAMNDGGLHQWNDEYPNRKIITADIDAGTLYKYAVNGDISGIIVLNEQYSPEYDELKWEYNTGKHLFVHRLCVHPEYQRQGIARKLMLFMEEHGAMNGYKSIRLDTSVLNKASLALYDGMGYRRVGIVHFRSGDFQCFEKALKRN